MSLLLKVTKDLSPRSRRKAVAKRLIGGYKSGGASARLNGRSAMATKRKKSKKSSKSSRKGARARASGPAGKARRKTGARHKLRDGRIIKGT